MAGRVLNLLLPTSYDCGSIGVGHSIGFPVLRRIDVSDFTEATLVVRLHAPSTISGAAALAGAGLYTDGFTTEDPAADFIGGFGGPPVAGVTFGPNDVAPTMNIAPASNFGGLLLFIVFFQQDTVVQGTISVRLSADLVLKSAPRRGSLGSRLPRDAQMLSNSDRAAFVGALGQRQMPAAAGTSATAVGSDPTLDEIR